MGRVICLLALCSQYIYAYDIPKIVRESVKHSNINAEIFVAMACVESSFNDRAIGDDGKSFGLMQIQLPTARDVGFRSKPTYLMYPKTNIKYAMRYLTYLYKKTSNVFIALDAYNRGLGNVQKRPYKKEWSEHRYVGKIIRFLEEKGTDKERCHAIYTRR